ncbi:MAG: hypothetical protein EXR17_00455 [Flavobacteriaceae bacterium]|nr:hypothetical protein [Flavobacteriaceae bacterium]
MLNFTGENNLQVLKTRPKDGGGSIPQRLGSGWHLGRFRIHPHPFPKWIGSGVGLPRLDVLINRL